MLIRFWILVSVQCLCSLGQRQRADRIGFIPRTEQNSRRVQQRMSAINRLKYTMNQMRMNNMKPNGMNSNNMGMSGMGSGGMGMNGMGSSNGGMNGMGFSNVGRNGMGSSHSGMNGMGSGMMGTGNGGGMGGNTDPMFQSGMSANGFSSNGANNNMNPFSSLGTSYLHPEQAEAMLALGALGINRNSRISLINVEALENGGFGMMGSGLNGNIRNNGRGGRRQRGPKAKLPLCQPLIECAERFIPPQCRSWRFDTVNSMMCRSCPINRCEGGAAEYFNTMYEHHPSRIMHSMLSK